MSRRPECLPLDRSPGSSSTRMQPVRRVIGITVATLSATLIAAGCGGSGDDATTSQAQARPDERVGATEKAGRPGNKRGTNRASTARNKDDASKDKNATKRRTDPTPTAAEKPGEGKRKCSRRHPKKSPGSASSPASSSPAAPARSESSQPPESSRTPDPSRESEAGRGESGQQPSYEELLEQAQKARPPNPSPAEKKEARQDRTDASSKRPGKRAAKCKRGRHRRAAR